MTAGRGIVHSETPNLQHGDMWGFQIWCGPPYQNARQRKPALGTACVQHYSCTLVPISHPRALLHNSESLSHFQSCLCLQDILPSFPGGCTTSVCPGKLTSAGAGRVNLPKANKMVKPFYQDIQAGDVKIVEEEGSRTRVLVGKYKGVTGTGLLRNAPGMILDVDLQPGASFSAEVWPHTLAKSHGCRHPVRATPQPSFGLPSRDLVFQKTTNVKRVGSCKLEPCSHLSAPC